MNEAFRVTSVIIKKLFRCKANLHLVIFFSFVAWFVEMNNNNNNIIITTIKGDWPFKRTALLLNTSW